MVADVLEVPVRADDRGARRPSTRDRRAAAVGPSGMFENARHSAAKRTPRGSCVRQRPSIAADAVVVRHATIRAEREIAAERGGRDQHRVEIGVVRCGRQPLAVERLAPERGIEAQHRDLLLDLAVAADHGGARPRGECAEDLGDLTLDERSERVVRERVVQVREQQVLPDEDPQLVAQIVELGRLVEAVPGMRSMFMPASRTSSSADRRSGSMSRARPDRSGSRPRRGRRSARRRRGSRARRARCRDPGPVRRSAPGSRRARHRRTSRRRHSRSTAARRAGPARRGYAATRWPPRDDQLALDGDRAVGLADRRAWPRGRRSARRARPRPVGRPPSSARRRALTVSRPSSPASRARTRRSSTTMPRRRSRVTGRHGPTAGGPGANPGARPSSVVRNQRRLPSATTAVRQRARGLRGSASRGARARQRIASSCDRPGDR